MRPLMLILCVSLLLPFSGCQNQNEKSATTKTTNNTSSNPTSKSTNEKAEADSNANLPIGDTVSNTESEIIRPVTETTDVANPRVVTQETAENKSGTTDFATTPAHELKILHWNIESGGNSPPLIAEQLLVMVQNSGYHILALSEVHAFKTYQEAFDTEGEESRWQSIVGESGADNGRVADRLMIIYDSTRVTLKSSQELTRFREHVLNSGRHRSPMVAEFECNNSEQSFLILHNHLARGNADFRTQQATGLREFARNSSLPIIAVGDYNFDYVFQTEEGNDGFLAFMKDGVWKWVKPDPLVDTNWYDREKDGTDDYPGSILDFTFVSGPAKEWDVVSNVIVREGDFPDDDRTSDHRPTEVILKY